MTSMTIENISVAERIRAGVITPLIMPARRPVHTWKALAGTRPAAQPARKQASPTNAARRRARRNGWYA